MVSSIATENKPPGHWDDLCLENSTYIPTDMPQTTNHYLHDDWLTLSEW